jgi:hypothetical protein
MALNKNHEFEEVDGVKCGIVEKNATPERVDFLKALLTFNGFTVMVAQTPAAKTALSKPLAEGEVQPPAPPPLPTTFTVGVTDYTFNATNAIFGRALKNNDGKIVTLAYWQQTEAVSNDEVPYFGNVVSE